MIDIQQYRIRIGYFNRGNSAIFRSYKTPPTLTDTSHSLFIMIIYLVYAIYSISLTLAILLNLTLNYPQQMVVPSILPVSVSPSMVDSNPWSIFSGAFLTLFLILNKRQKLFRKRTSSILVYTLLFIAIVRLLLLVICNCSIINPGPLNLKVFFRMSKVLFRLVNLVRKSRN